MREMREQVRRMHNEADTGAELVELDELRALTEVAPTAIHIFQACPFSAELSHSGLALPRVTIAAEYS